MHNLPEAASFHKNTGPFRARWMRCIYIKTYFYDFVNNARIQSVINDIVSPIVALQACQQ